MGEAQDFYNYAVKKTGINDPVEAVEALVEYGEINIEKKLEIGDTVKLNSGGPLMTIQHFNDDKCVCRWFDGNELKSSEFYNSEIYVSEESKIPEIEIDEDELSCNLPF